MIQSLPDSEPPRQEMNSAGKCRNISPDKTSPERDHGLVDGTAVLLLYQRKYTVPQAAKILNIGETKMRKCIRKGLIPVLDLDGKCLVLEQDLEAFLNGRYGTVRKARDRKPGLPPLPLYVAESQLLKKVS